MAVTMYVLALAVDLHLPDSRSLKDRRALIRPILDGARHRHRVSVADVGPQDSWRQARLGFAVVASAYRQAVDVIDHVERFVWSFPEVEVTGTQRHWLDVEAE